jgi:Uma2 family endonuclease
MRPNGYAKDPVLIAEVLSPSTMDNDRGRKLAFYKSIATLRTLLIVYQDEVRVEAWERDGDAWSFRVLKGLSETLPIPTLATELSVKDVYADVPFESRT